MKGGGFRATDKQKYTVENPIEEAAKESPESAARALGPRASGAAPYEEEDS